jgi:hypothetical protein
VISFDSTYSINFPAQPFIGCYIYTSKNKCAQRERRRGAPQILQNVADYNNRQFL